MTRITITKTFIFLLSLVYSYWISYALDFSTLSSRITSCPMANVNAEIYFENWQTQVLTWVYDAFWSNTNRYIANSWTTIRLYNWTSPIVSWCNSSSAWNKYSDLAPAWNVPVIAVAATNGCTFSRPTDPSNNQVQFVFNIRRWDIFNTWTTNQTLSYITRTSWLTWSPVTQTQTFNNFYPSNYVVDANECLNVTLRWCWDWIRQSVEWEQCDAWTQNWVPWSWCSSTCTTVQTTCTAWSYTRPLTARITSAYPNLCPTWQTVGGFTENLVWWTYNYSWTCNWLSGWNCIDSYTPPPPQNWYRDSGLRGI